MFGFIIALLIINTVYMVKIIKNKKTGIKLVFRVIIIFFIPFIGIVMLEFADA